MCSTSGLVAAALATGVIVAHRVQHAADRSVQPCSTSGRLSPSASAWTVSAALRRVPPKSDSSARSVAFAGDGSSLVGGLSSGTLVQLDTRTGEAASGGRGRGGGTSMAVYVGCRGAIRV